MLKDNPLPSEEKVYSQRIEIFGVLNICLIISTIFILFIDSIGIMMRSILLITTSIISIIFRRNSERGHTIDLVPFREVAITFFVIFIVIAPVLFTLETNSDLLHRQIDEWKQYFDESTIYFSMCALASSFLDNAPSYLLFFNMAGGDASELMTSSPNILKAISVSAVVMGSMTYIGNAPNMMVKSIAQKNGVKMPSFLWYMGWAAVIIIPLSIIVNLLID
jgi:Na+/H+ antiporter NhaD/arsenite permease-like protein